MLEALRFVKGAVATKDFSPALTHFRIANGRVTGFNGVVALSSPIELDLTACPRAREFVKAIERCDVMATITLTPSGNLSLKSGAFRATINCFDDTEVLESIVPEGEEIDFGDEFMDALTKLYPIVGNDASRPWSNGILLRGKSAYATDNIAIAEYWLGYDVPEVNIPALAVKEMLRLGATPKKTLVSDTTMTFYFAEGRWLRIQLLETTWPKIDHILDQEGDLKPVPFTLFEAVETIAPFVGDTGAIYFRKDRISTSAVEGEGASYEVEGVPERGAFHYARLLRLDTLADEIDFDKHPAPCPFRGERVRGVILGMHDDKGKEEQ